MEKVLELLKDEAFVAELDKLEKEEDVIALFESRGATVTMDQLRELINLLPDKDEITDDDLEKVAGGLNLITIRTYFPNTRTILTNTITITGTIWKLKSKGFWCRRW